MRGGDNRTGSLFSYVDLEARVRGDHPLRTIRRIVNEALAALEREFATLYSPIGRPSIPPEKLLRAMLLQAFYSIRSERLSTAVGFQATGAEQKQAICLLGMLIVGDVSAALRIRWWRPRRCRGRPSR